MLGHAMVATSTERKAPSTRTTTLPQDKTVTSRRGFVKVDPCILSIPQCKQWISRVQPLTPRLPSLDTTANPYPTPPGTTYNSSRLLHVSLLARPRKLLKEKISPFLTPADPLLLHKSGNKCVKAKKKKKKYY